MNAIISALVLSERDDRLYFFHCLMLFGPLFGYPSLSLGSYPLGFLLVNCIGSRILLHCLPTLSLCLQQFQWRLLAFRIGRRIPALGRLLIIFKFQVGFRPSIRNIWIRDCSLEDSVRCAWTCWMAVNADNLYTVWSLRAGELLLCQVVPLMIVVIGESKASGTGLHCPPPRVPLISKRESV